MKEPTTFVCSICGEALSEADCVTFGGQYLCQSCYEEQTATCDRCGERIWRDDDCGDDTHTLCRHCEEHYYEHCADCGRLVEASDLHYLHDDEGYCERCHSRRYEAGGVQSYCYKPEPIFYGCGPRYFGVELEIDGGGETSIHANMICRIGNQDGNHIYIKRDGSLDDGLEIVTHPMTLDYHMDRMPCEETLGEALDLGYTSHQAGTCGLHVHVNRASLGDSY